MAEQFKVGNIVQLKSGGPPMTVKSVEALDGECFCEWFGDGSTLKSHTFFPETLKEAKACEKLSLEDLIVGAGACGKS
jgi:uncharacterized protein YodC (DUF2158 family)